MTLTDDKHDIQAFWGALYDSLYGNGGEDITREQLLEALDALEDMFRLRRHMAVVEMPLESLKGTRVLEIGPGAGGHSALFARHGAIVTAVDITRVRADFVIRSVAPLAGNSPIIGLKLTLPEPARAFTPLFRDQPSEPFVPLCSQG